MIARRTVNLNDGRLLILEAIGARHVKLYTNSNNLQTFNDPFSIKDNIIKIDINDEFILDLEDPDLSILSFPITDTFKAEYHLNKILKTDKNTYLLETLPRSNSSYFIPPLIVPSREWIDWNRLFANAYFANIKEPDDMYYVGLLFRFIPTEAYHALEAKLTKLTSFFKQYPWDYSHELFTFTITEEQSNDLELILSSKYSKITEQLKKRILAFHGFSDDGTFAKVLCKHPDLRRQLELELLDSRQSISEDVELFDRIDLSKELLTIKDNALTEIGRVSQLP